MSSSMLVLPGNLFSTGMSTAIRVYLEACDKLCEFLRGELCLLNIPTSSMVLKGRCGRLRSLYRTY